MELLPDEWIGLDWNTRVSTKYHGLTLLSVSSLAFLSFTCMFGFSTIQRTNLSSSSGRSRNHCLPMQPTSRCFCQSPFRCGTEASPVPPAWSRLLTILARPHPALLDSGGSHRALTTHHTFQKHLLTWEPRREAPHTAVSLYSSWCYASRLTAIFTLPEYQADYL